MAKAWHLLADIGGTNARFALGDAATGGISHITSVSVKDHATPGSALQIYLAQIAASGGWQAHPEDACLALACPTDREVITFTNSHWVIDRKELMRSLKIPRVLIINDFEAIGYAVVGLTESDWVQIGDGNARSGGMIAVLGPGTGLGVCGALPVGSGVTVIAGEGGHVDFAPVDDDEIDILRLLRARHGRVSAERLLSGAGLQNIYWALSQMRDVKCRQQSPEELSAAGLSGSDAVAAQALSVFCRILGGVAGNLALTYGAVGGVFVAGGIAPRMVEFLRESDFRERFLAKGRFREYLSDIPTRVITRSNPGLYGALQFLQTETAE